MKGKRHFAKLASLRQKIMVYEMAGNLMIEKKNLERESRTKFSRRSDAFFAEVTFFQQSDALAS